MSDPLDVLRARLDGAVIALDYDGTLAPIVARPSDAVAAPGAVEVLAALAARVRTLALVTGRPADVVVALGGLVDVPGLVVLGQYGAQRWAGGEVSAPEELPGVAPAPAALPALVALEGAAREAKGRAGVVAPPRPPPP
ncbi:MAG: trehalose-phosphatase, partial [Frankiaceae bacterium]|nr:trehalose-phosphatase [Frankiaceae bacterium]